MNLIGDQRMNWIASSLRLDWRETGLMKAEEAAVQKDSFMPLSLGGLL